MFVPVYDDNPLKSIQFQMVTVALIVINVIVFALEAGGLQENVIAGFAVIPFELLKPAAAGFPGPGPQIPVNVTPIAEPVTLLSYMFFHGDIFHLAGNMLFLWVFGDNVEDAMGHLKFLAFYIVCGIVGAAVHALAIQLLMPAAAKVPLIGASAAVAGVIGAYIMLHPRVRVWVLAFRFIPLRISAALTLGAWIATQFVMVMLPMTGPVAWWAHIGGILAGVVLVLFLRRPGVLLFDKNLRAA